MSIFVTLCKSQIVVLIIDLQYWAGLGIVVSALEILYKICADFEFFCKKVGEKFGTYIIKALPLSHQKGMADSSIG